MSFPDAKEFVRFAGRIDLGEIGQEIADAVGVMKGPIRLQYGIPSATGFGKRHVEAKVSRMRQLRANGYQSFEHFAFTVCQRYGRICQGDGERIILAMNISGYDHCAIIQYQYDAGVWNVVTGLMKRVERANVLYSVPRTGGSEPTPSVAGKRPRFERLTLPSNPRKGTGDSDS